jgi:hypothetical protein
VKERKAPAARFHSAMTFKIDNSRDYYRAMAMLIGAVLVVLIATRLAPVGAPRLGAGESHAPLARAKDAPLPRLFEERVGPPVVHASPPGGVPSASELAKAQTGDDYQAAAAPPSWRPWRALPFAGGPQRYRSEPVGN